MKHLYFVRHGESEFNVSRLFAGRTDTPLTPRGREQAALAGAHADSLHLDVIVSSPLSRALETAQIIAREANYPLNKIITNDLFLERAWGELEGQPYSAGGEDPTRFSGVESVESLRDRAQAGLQFLRDLDADTVLLVGHGSFSAALRAAINRDAELAELPNAQIVQLI